jgi:L-lactate dehydrogenase complex protein LldG
VNGTDLAARFLANAATAAAGTHLLPGADALPEALARIVPPDAKVYCPGATAIEQAVADLFPNRVADYVEATVTVEEVFGAVAETGSLVCASEGGRAVQAGLLPSHHVAILRRGKIFATLDGLFSAVASTPPANLTLVTGPSRTADIELTLAIGVHGPERLTILVV